MLSMVTAVMVCAVLGTMTVAPMSRPNDCATSCVSITHAQLAKKPPAVRLQPVDHESAICEECLNKAVCAKLRRHRARIRSGKKAEDMVLTVKTADPGSDIPVERYAHNCTEQCRNDKLATPADGMMPCVYAFVHLRQEVQQQGAI